MKTAVIMCVIALVAIAGVFYFLHPAARAENAAPPAPQEKWEYGFLSMMDFPELDSGVYFWVDKDNNIAPPREKDAKDTSSQSMEKLYKAMAAKWGVANIPKDCGNHPSLYNLIGSQGWEFVNREEKVSNGSTQITIVFKRRLP